MKKEKKKAPAITWAEEWRQPVKRGNDVLATTPQPFFNGQISVTTVGEIRNIGMDVIPDPTNSNPYHASIVPQNTPMTSTEAQGLSNLFQREKNTWKK